MKRLRLSPSASVTRTSVGVILRSDLGAFQLDGADLMVFVERISKWLDGSRDREQIVAELPDYSRESVAGFLDLLAKAGVVEEVEAETDDAPNRPAFEFFRKWTQDADAAVEKLRGAHLLIIGLSPWGVVAATELACAGVGRLTLIDDGEVARDDLSAIRIWSGEDVRKPRRDALRRKLETLAPAARVATSGVVLEAGRLIYDGDRPDLVLACAPGDDLPLLKAVAHYAHDSGAVSLHAQLDGVEARVGPATYPGQTACWNCARLRLLANSEIPEAAHALQEALFTERPTPRAGMYLGPMPGLLGHLVAAEALKLLTDYTPSRLGGRLLLQNLVNHESSYHGVVRMPWCEVCGGASADPPNTGAVAAPTKKKLNEIETDEALRAEFDGWIDSRTGVLRHLALVVAEDSEPDLPITAMSMMCDYTEGHYHPSPEPFINSGNGLKPMRALIGAFGEGLERYSASRFRHADMTRASLADLDGDALDPRTLPGYSEAQYASPGFPCSRYDPKKPTHWMRGRWLDTGAPVWLPALLVYFNFRAPRGEFFQQVSSNGLAAGADADDAALRATAELLERDAFMTAWHCRKPGVRVIPDALDAPYREVLRQLGRNGTQVELYRLDVGAGMPVVLCLAMGDGVNWPGATAALGAHPDLRTATEKAILEQGAVGPYIRRLMRDGKAIPERPEDVRDLNDHALFYAPPERRRHLDFLRGSDEIRLSQAESAQASLAGVVAGLHAGGLRVAVADVTSPDLAPTGIRVARALGPDIQPIDFGFGVRRLENPRLRRLLAGAEPNPYPHPLA